MTKGNDKKSDPYQMADKTDALVIVTEWSDFTDLDFGLLKTKMNMPVLIDTKNMLDDRELVNEGFSYLGVGRGK